MNLVKCQADHKKMRLFHHLLRCFIEVFFYEYSILPPHILRALKVGNWTRILTKIQVLVQDLLHPTAASEAKKHKLKTLVQAPRSFFMDVKCPGCLNITTVFSHAQTAVTCDSCATVLTQPTGGKAKLTEGCSFRRK